MREIKGLNNTAKIFADEVEDLALEQVQSLCDQENYKECKIRMMPDLHAGEGCTIGTTMTIKDRINPYFVGVDIGCGVFVVKLKNKLTFYTDEEGKKIKALDLKELDECIRKYIPYGHCVHEDDICTDTLHSIYKKKFLPLLKCKEAIDIDYCTKSIGTLGGGNHFISIEKDKDDNLYLLVHSGSRNLGKRVADYYYKKGKEYVESSKDEKKKIIAQYKAEGRKKEINKALSKIKNKKVKPDEVFVEGELLKDYLFDLKLCQDYAHDNRACMALEIVSQLNLDVEKSFHTVHNYIDVDSMILRKGAISAQKDEMLIIPLNMRDGSIIAIGKGNEDWNYSAPHGAGRKLSRKKAKENISMEDFKKSMEGIYSTTVNESTLDESPMAYKSKENIINNIKDTVDVVDILTPVYNFKADNEIDFYTRKQNK